MDWKTGQAGCTQTLILKYSLAAKQGRSLAEEEEEGAVISEATFFHMLFIWFGGIELMEY